MKDFLLNTYFLGNQLSDYLVAVIVFILLNMIFTFIRKKVIGKIREFAEITKFDFDDFLVDLLESVRKWYYGFLNFYLAFLPLNFGLKIEGLWKFLLLAFTLVQISIFVKILIHYILQKTIKVDTAHEKTLEDLITRVSIFVLWVLGIMTYISRLGVDITAMLAGFGIGGIAIAFALQSVLKDLFSYFTIVLDRPVEEGDFITVAGEEGTVKKIGVKTTRLTGVDGREVIVSNDAITSGVLDNSGKREYRRVRFEMGAAYGTPVSKLKNVKEGIIKIIDDFEKAELLRVHFRDFGESSLNFFIDCKVSDLGFDEYLDLREEINFQILELFEKEGVEIPFPTRTVFNKQG